MGHCTKSLRDSPLRGVPNGEVVLWNFCVII